MFLKTYFRSWSIENNLITTYKKFHISYCINPKCNEMCLKNSVLKIVLQCFNSNNVKVNDKMENICYQN